MNFRLKFNAKLVPRDKEVTILYFGINKFNFNLFAVT